MRLLGILLYAAMMLLLFGCNQLWGEGAQQTPIARVGDKVLYLQEVLPSNTAQLNREDSAKLVREQINKWVEQTLLLQRAELNLTDDSKNIQKQLEDYRRSLLIYAYEKEFVNQKLDTVVSEEEVERYYEANKANFELKDYVVKVLYVKVDNQAPQQQWLEKALATEEGGEQLYEIEDYCRQFAANFMLDGNIWLYFNDILKEIPIETYNIENFLKTNKFVRLQDEEFTYYLRIKDYRLKDSVSPLDLERERIKNIILNKRKLALIETMRKELYQDALAKNQIEYFTK